MPSNKSVLGMWLAVIVLICLTVIFLGYLTSIISHHHHKSFVIGIAAYVFAVRWLTGIILSLTRGCGPIPGELRESACKEMTETPCTPDGTAQKCDLVLESQASDQVTQVLRELYMEIPDSINRDLKCWFKAVDGAAKARTLQKAALPVTIRQGITRAEAEFVKSKLEAAGASVSIKESNA